MKVPDFNLSGKGNQVYALRLVNLAHQTDIKILIDPSIASLTAEINSAVSRWNNAVSNVRFRVVTSGTYDVLIKNANTGSRGNARLPLNGLPGNLININLAEISGDNSDQRAMVITHELGHAIGFMHTDSPNGTVTQDGITTNITNVPGWGGLDGSSVMNCCDCGNSPTQLSSKDKNALYALYPHLDPKNTQIQITPYTGDPFVITWSQQPPILSDNVTLVGYELSYSGFSGINFGANVSLSPSPTSYTIPGVSPYPSSGSTTTGGIQVIVRAKYSDGQIYSGPTVYRQKVNGVWGNQY